MSDSDPRATESPTIGNLREFLSWVAARRRTYAEAMEAWRTSCPRLSAWEDATNDGLVQVEQADAATQGEAVVCLTERGAAFLGHARPAPDASYPCPVDSVR
jgi:hypothetical protein